MLLHIWDCGKDIDWSYLSDSNGIRTVNHLLRKLGQFGQFG